MNLNAAWRSSVLPAVLVPAAIGAELAASVRERLVGYRRYALLDRGSYDVIDDVSDLGEILDVLAGVASAVTGRPFTVAAARAIRLRPGDYILTRHDVVHENRPTELVLDLSAAPVAGAEVHFRHRGQVYFVMPSAPGTLAVVERGPTVLCNHTYVSKRLTGEVVRLVVRSS